MSTKIAIIGLGRIGSTVFEQLQGRQRQGIEIACVCEQHDTPGRGKAQKAGVPVMSMDQIVALGASIDMIFDMTGIPKVRKDLREKLHASDNKHTVVVPEGVAYLIWALLSGEHVPDKDHRSGY
jgi:predicted dinucleotide-utilizing enzyme